MKREGREVILVSYHPHHILAPGGLEHTHEGGRTLLVRFSLGISWSSRVPHLGSVIFAFA